MILASLNLGMYRKMKGFKRMKQEIKKLVCYILAGTILYIVIRYWPKFESITLLGISAAVPLILGAAMAYAINILMNFYEKLYKRVLEKTVLIRYKRMVCLIMAILSLIAIVFMAIYLVLPELINCVASFVQLIPRMVEDTVDVVQKENLLEKIPFVKEWLEGFEAENIANTLEQILTNFKGNIELAVGSIVNVVAGVVSAVITFVVGIIFSIYILYDKEKLGRQLRMLVSTYIPKRAERIFYVTKVLNDSFHNFIVGQCIEAVILGSLCTVCMLVVGLPYAVMIGVFIGFTALIPIAGAYIGASVGAILILSVSPIQALEFIGLIVLLQQIEGNMIYPRIVGKSIGLPGIWVLTAIAVGGGMNGIPGMLLAVPLFAAGYRLIKEDVCKRQPPIAVVKNDEKTQKKVDETLNKTK